MDRVDDTVGELSPLESDRQLRGDVVPEAGGDLLVDPFVAEVDATKCTGDGACLEACLREGALALVGSEGAFVARVNSALCMGCGACVAVCEQGAININGWTLDQYEAMVDAIVST
jgi:heterodisulfide reductase subunit A